MAKTVWFSVLVLVLIQQVLSLRDCKEASNNNNCDDCIRCGFTWCMEKDFKEPRCSRAQSEEWCPGERLPQYVSYVADRSGSAVDLRRVEAQVVVAHSEDITLNIRKPTTKSTVTSKVLSSTTNDTSTFAVTVKSQPKGCLSKQQCTAEVSVKPSLEFCPLDGITLETVEVELEVEGLEEKTLMTYHVPCACECSKRREEQSVKCNKRGDFMCEGCFCYKGWEGPHCEFTSTPKVPPMTQRPPSSGPPPDCRGDAFSVGCRPDGVDVNCYGNGWCDECDVCRCNMKLEGSQYFETAFCTDICTQIIEEDVGCLLNQPIGPCAQNPNIEIQGYNKTLVEERDASDRKVWIQCTTTVTETEVIFFAMRPVGTGNGETVVMIVNEATADSRGAQPVAVVVPAVLGVLLVAAAAAAVAGYLVYKARAPALPLNDPGYHNIDAEDCTGENPLYKPPTSSFKNPTYGKW